MEMSILEKNVCRDPLYMYSEKKPFCNVMDVLRVSVCEAIFTPDILHNAL